MKTDEREQTRYSRSPASNGAVRTYMIYLTTLSANVHRLPTIFCANYVAKMTRYYHAQIMHVTFKHPFVVHNHKTRSPREQNANILVAS